MRHDLFSSQSPRRPNYLQTSGWCCWHCAQQGSQFFISTDKSGGKHSCACSPELQSGPRAVATSSCAWQKGTVGRLIVGVSTGHAGSATLSSARCFNGSNRPSGSSAIGWSFECLHRYADNRDGLLNGRGLSGWYESLAASSSNRGDLSPMQLLNNTLLPDLLLEYNRQPETLHKTPVNTREDVKRTSVDTPVLVDLGHQFNLGLLRPLVQRLGPQVAFVRIIRSRYDTVRSFLSEGKAPCGHGMFTLCPLRHPDIVLRPSKGHWARFSKAQQNMWYIDEVEARWQQLLEAGGVQSQLTVSWCSPSQFLKAWEEVARFIGEGLRPRPCEHHTHTSTGANSRKVAAITDAELLGEDRTYRKAMGYDAAIQRQLVHVQFRHSSCEVLDAPGNSPLPAELEDEVGAGVASPMLSGRRPPPPLPQPAASPPPGPSAPLGLPAGLLNPGGAEWQTLWPSAPPLPPSPSPSPPLSFGLVPSLLALTALLACVLAKRFAKPVLTEISGSRAPCPGRRVPSEQRRRRNSRTTRPGYTLAPLPSANLEHTQAGTEVPSV